MRRLSTVLIALTLSLGGTGQSASAQTDFTISAVGEVGYLISVRSMGKHTGELDEQNLFQLISDFQDVPTVGAGIAVTFPGLDLTVRGMYETTLGGSADSQVAFCGDPDDPFATGLVCRLEEIDVDIQSFHLDLQFLRGAVTDVVRPFLGAGFGLRSYQFGPQPTCPGPEQDPAFVCEKSNELWQGESMSPVFLFGFGVQGKLGPLATSAEFQNQFSRYNGGTGNASGNAMNDINLSLTARLNLF